MTTYEMWNKEFDDSNDAGRFLTAMFNNMCQDCGIDYRDDSAAWRECFNDWTDCLNKDGIICDESYQDLCPIGSKFE